jgi:hypothetical protein
MRPVLRAVIVGSVAALLLGGCSASSDDASSGGSPAGGAAAGDVVRLWIAPELAECTGVGLMECMQVAYEEGGPSELFYETIDGFTFEEGTSSVIDVRVEQVDSPPADGSSLAFTLVEVVSQTPQ